MNKPELILALFATVLQCVVAALVVRSGIIRRFRFFFSCIVLSIVTTFAAFALRGDYRTYFYFYWVAESINVVLTLFALHELFFAVFRNFYPIRWFRYLFPAASLVLMGISSARTLLHPATDAFPLLRIILSLEIAVRLLQVGLFGLFVVLVSFFHLRWQQLAFGFAFGFGLSAGGSLFVFLLRSEFGTEVDPVVRIVPPIAYTLAVVIWLLTLLLGQRDDSREGRTSTLNPEEMLAEIKQYTRTAKDILKR